MSIRATRRTCSASPAPSTSVSLAARARSGRRRSSVELVHQNEETETQSAARLQLSQELGKALHVPHDRPAVPEETHRASWILIGTPQVLPVEFRRLALTESIVRATSARLAAVLARQTLHPRSEPPRPAGSAFVVEGRSNRRHVCARRRLVHGHRRGNAHQSLRRPAFHTGQIGDIRVASLLNLVFGTLTDLGASGRGLCNLTMRVNPTLSGARHAVTLRSANQGYAMDTAKPFNWTTRCFSRLRMSR